MRRIVGLIHFQFTDRDAVLRALHPLTLSPTVAHIGAPRKISWRELISPRWNNASKRTTSLPRPARSAESSLSQVPHAFTPSAPDLKQPVLCAVAKVNGRPSGARARSTRRQNFVFSAASAFSRWTDPKGQIARRNAGKGMAPQVGLVLCRPSASD